MASKISSCISDKPNIPPDGTTAATITANVVDSAGSGPLSGETVSWTVLGNGTLSQQDSVSDANGDATVSLTASVAGTITVTATTTDDQTGMSANVTAAVILAENVQSITSSLVTIPSDGSVGATLKATIVDAAGLPLENIVVTWAITAGNGAVDPTTSSTDVTGVASSTLTATGLGLLTVSATTPADITGTTITVVPTAPLAAPTVLNATSNDAYTLDGVDIKFGVTATIPYYGNAEANNIVTFYWGNLNYDFAIDDPDADLPMMINVSEFDPDALLDGEHSVYYAVTDTAGNQTISSGLNITVENGGHTTETLAAPAVPQADDGYINIQDALNGVIVNVSYPGMAANDLITLYWAAFDKHDVTIAAASIAATHVVSPGETEYELSIPVDSFFPVSGIGYEGSVNAYYTVRPASGTGILSLSYSKHCRVDTLAP